MECVIPMECPTFGHNGYTIHNVSRNPNLCVQYLDIFNMLRQLHPRIVQVITEEMVGVINSMHRRVHSILLAIYKSIATETEVRCQVLLKVITALPMHLSISSDEISLFFYEVASCKKNILQYLIKNKVQKNLLKS